MKGPSLQITVVFSILAHITIFFAALIAMKQTNHFIMPSSYTVDLVGPETGKSGVSEQEYEEAEKPPMIMPDETSAKHKTPEDAQQYISDRIAAFEATRKMKRIVKLRNIISIKGAPESNADETTVPVENAGDEAAMDSYFDRISKEIRHRWAFPEAWGKNLEAIVLVTILRDGTIKVIRIEKGSGNLLFDASVLKAITKASPVSPPPYEMEKALRFTP